MLASDLTPAYVNYDQKPGSTSGNTTSYPTELNYSCAYHKGSLGNKTQNVTIKVTKDEPVEPTKPDIITPSELGKVIGASKTIVLRKGNAGDRTNCLAVKCEYGVYAEIDGTSYTWKGASTDGVVSATSGDGSWHPAVIIASGWDKESLAKGWLYQSTDGSNSHTQMSEPNCNTYGVFDPRLGSYNANSDGTITIDGKVYGPEL